MKLFDWVIEFFLPVTVKLTALWIYLKERKCYYHNACFKEFDQAFHRLYRYKNPYSMCKKHVLSTGAKDGDVYGESPLSVYQTLIQVTNLSEKSLFLELGSGRGRGLFFTHFFSGCQSEGVEFVKPFCKLSNQLIHQLNLKKVKVHQKNLYRYQLDKADVIYFCTTLLSEAEIEVFLKQLRFCKPTAKIVTTSFSLSEYSTNYQTTFEFEERFLFGKVSVFINELV